MQRLVDSYKNSGTLHHAYFLVGDGEEIVLKLKDFLGKEVGVKISGSADFWHGKFNTLNIEGARNIAEAQERKDFSSGKKIFIISTRFVTIEAQNSLLKLFEEPTENTHFFLVMPNIQVLIPTLRSRLVIVDGNIFENGEVGSEKVEIKNEFKSLAKKFLIAGSVERIVLVKNIVEEKDKGKAIDFVTALEEVLAKNIGKNNMTENAGALTEILMVKRYLHDRAPSIKLLLEHLCLFVTIPKQ